MMVGDLTLPVLAQPVETMTQKQLKSMVSNLVRSSQGDRSIPTYGKSSSPPVWWPAEVPFANPATEDSKKVPNKTLVMRSIIRSCYEYYGKEEMLGSPRASSPLRPVNHTNVSNCQRSNQQHRDVSAAPGLDIPLCTRPDMMDSGLGKSLHGESCLKMLASSVPRHGTLSGEMKCDQAKHSPESVAVLKLENWKKDVIVIGDEEETFLEIFICFFCEKEFEDKTDLQHHHSSCTMQPPKLHSINELPWHCDAMPIRPPKLSIDSPDFYVRADRKEFTESLGLCLKSKAEALENKNKDRKVDCDVIDVGERAPKTPTTPRTPKSLMSQLSKEFSSSPRQSLSRPLLPPGDGEANSNASSGDEESESDSDSDCSDGSKSETITSKKRKTLTCRCRSLLVIDFCSPLGQRVRKHICDDEELQPSYSIDEVCSNAVRFCHSPTKKNVGDRLRSRGVQIPVTFRKSKRTAPEYWHRYKFTSHQRHEFYRRVETGLNARSRKLLKRVKKCCISLQKLTYEDLQSFADRIHPGTTMLTEEEVEMWTRKHYPGFSDTDLDMSEEDGIFPQGPGLLGSRSELQRLLGLKTHHDMSSREGSPSQPLELSQVVSEDDNAEVNQQKVLVYRTLLSELSRGPQQSASTSSNPMSTHDLTPPSTPEDQMSLQDLTFDTHIKSTPRLSDKNLAMANGSSTLTSTPTKISCSAQRHPSLTSMPQLRHILSEKPAKDLPPSQCDILKYLTCQKNGKNARTVLVESKQKTLPNIKSESCVQDKVKKGGKDKVENAVKQTLKRSSRSGCSKVIRDEKSTEIKKTDKVNELKKTKNRLSSQLKIGKSTSEVSCAKQTAQKLTEISEKVAKPLPESKKTSKLESSKETKQNLKVAGKKMRKNVCKSKKSSRVLSTPAKKYSQKPSSTSVSKGKTRGKEVKSETKKQNSNIVHTRHASRLGTASANIKDTALNNLGTGKGKSPKEATKSKIASGKGKSLQNQESAQANILTSKGRHTGTKDIVQRKGKLSRKSVDDHVQKHKVEKASSSAGKGSLSGRQSKALPENSSATSRKRSAESPAGQHPSKYAKAEAGRQPVPCNPPVNSKTPAPIKPLLLFRCHLCGAEIACREKFKELVIKHFDSVHKVHSIRLVEQEGPEGQTLLTIVEDLTMPSSPEIPHRPTDSHASTNKKESSHYESDSLWDPVDRCLFGDKRHTDIHSDSSRGASRRNIARTTSATDTNQSSRMTKKMRRTMSQPCK